jgi:hypothetical protein
MKTIRNCSLPNYVRYLTGMIQIMLGAFFYVISHSFFVVIWTNCSNSSIYSALEKYIRICIESGKNQKSKRELSVCGTALAVGRS